MKSITVTGVDVFLKPSTKALSLGFSILLFICEYLSLNNKRKLFKEQENRRFLTQFSRTIYSFFWCGNFYSFFSQPVAGIILLSFGAYHDYLCFHEFYIQ